MNPAPTHPIPLVRQGWGAPKNTKQSQAVG